MAFNKDIEPTSLGKDQKAPRDVFQAMNQGSLERDKHNNGGPHGNMRQGNLKASFNGPKGPNNRMKQGGGK